MSCVQFSLFTMTFANQVCYWLIRVVWSGINQSQTRIVKDILNSDNSYVFYLLCIIDIQNIFNIRNSIQINFIHP